MKKILLIFLLLILWTSVFSQEKLERIYDFPFSNVPTSIFQEDNGDFLIFGTINKLIDSYSDDYWSLMRTNSLGDTLWTKYYKLANGGISSIVKAEGGYVITGPIFHNTLILKIDHNGEIIWETHVPVSPELNGLNPLSIDNCSDGGFIVLCEGIDSVALTEDFFLYKIIELSI